MILAWADWGTGISVGGPVNVMKGMLNAVARVQGKGGF